MGGNKIVKKVKTSKKSENINDLTKIKHNNIKNRIRTSQKILIIEFNSFGWPS